MREREEYQQLVSQYCSYSRVSVYVKAVLSRVAPNAVVGSSHNCKVLFAPVDAFVAMRRYERFSVAQVMEGIRPSGCDWALPKPKSKPKEKEETSACGHPPP